MNAPVQGTARIFTEEYACEYCIAFVPWAATKTLEAEPLDHLNKVLVARTFQDLRSNTCLIRSNMAFPRGYSHLIGLVKCIVHCIGCRHPILDCTHRVAPPSIAWGILLAFLGPTCSVATLLPITWQCLLRSGDATPLALGHFGRS